jgi:hypothetical protein
MKAKARTRSKLRTTPHSSKSKKHRTYSRQKRASFAYFVRGGISLRPEHSDALSRLSDVGLGGLGLRTRFSGCKILCGPNASLEAHLRLDILRTADILGSRKLKDCKGTLRFYLTLTADNTPRTTCEVDITCHQDWHTLRGEPVRRRA